MFTDGLLCAREEGCSRESLRPRIVVEGKSCEEKPRGGAWGSWFKGLILRSGGGLTQLSRLHIPCTKPGTCQGTEAGGDSKGTSGDEQKGDVPWIHFVACLLLPWRSRRGELVLPVGERLGHCARGGRRDHILSISSYFCISVSFFF